MADAKIRAVITAEDRASGVLQGFDNKIGGIGNSIKKLLVGAVSFYALERAISGVVGIAWKSIQAFAEEELAVTRLQAGINNVRSATDKHIGALLEQASALQMVTRFSDDAVISAQGILSTFQFNQEVITAITPRLIDMAEGIARVSGGLPDLEGNANLVAKALGGEDVEGLVGALRRANVMMTVAQTEILKTGSFEERLSIITQVLDDNFKGMGEAAGTTTAGKLAILQNALGDLQEQFGGALATAITPFIEKLTTWARTDEARATIQNIADKVANVITQFGIFIRDNWPQIKDTLKSLADVAWGVVRAIDFMASVARTAFEWLSKLADLWGRSPGDVRNAFGGQIRGNAGGGGSFQMGGRVMGGIPVKVGEAGPETFVPSGAGTIVPNHEAMGGNVTLNVNIGMFAGTPLERRKIAETMLNDLRDIARMTGQTPAQMLGA